MKKPELNERNEKPEIKMSNFNAINVPVPPPLTRQVCYLPEHYHPFVKHSEESNCLCSFCEHKRFVSAKQMEVAIKELPQIEALNIQEESFDWSLVGPPGKLTRLICDGLEPSVILHDMSPKIMEPDHWSLYPIVVPDDEEILLKPAVSRSLEMPIPTLSRSTNDPSTWEDEEEILLTALSL